MRPYVESAKAFSGWAFPGMSVPRPLDVYGAVERLPALPLDGSSSENETHPLGASAVGVKNSESSPEFGADKSEWAIQGSNL